MRQAVLCFCLCSSAGLQAAIAPMQQDAGQMATVRGLVTDPTGAVIPGATLVLHPAGGGSSITAISTSTGTYILTAPAGTQGTLDVTAPGFAPYLQPSVKLLAGAANVLNIKLIIATQNEQLEVSGDTADTTDPNNNADSITLKGHALDLLPTDQTQLQQQLEALSGGDSPDLYVNGFTGGKLPPKDTIREIRINQNPYSALNDTNPNNGRIEIFTKPGSDTIHGDFFAYGNDSALNSQNPFAPNQPAYYQTYSEGSIGGPINKRSSYFFSLGRRSYQGNTIVNAQTLNGPFNQALAAPVSVLDFSARYDASLGKSSTLTARYSLEQNNQINGGAGQLTLASEGFNSYATTHTLQISNSQVLTPKIVNDTRFQYIRSRTHQAPVSTAPSVLVQGAFNGGGSPLGATRDNLDRYELQNYVTAAEGKQYMTFGGRLRVARDANQSLANYNGSYAFPSLDAYRISVANQAACAQGLPSCQTDAQIRAAGGGPSLFTLAAGTPVVTVSLADVGIFFQDDIKLRPNLTLSAGLRFESQSGISDHGDYGPRLGFSYGLFAKKDKPAPYTLYGGAGLFYGRFAYTSLAQAERQNGVTQQQYIIQAPAFYPSVPAPSTLSANAPSSIYQIASGYHAPVFTTETIALDRRLGNIGTLSANFVNNQGTHTPLQRNINAPLPGTFVYGVTDSGTRPFGGTQNIYEYEDEGSFASKRLSVDLNLHTHKLYVNGYYRLLFSRSDVDGSFPSNQYDLHTDNSRATTDQRQRLGVFTSAPLPFGFSAFSFVHVLTGNPFNITLGQDLNGDAQFNDRPTFATDLTRPSVVHTQYGYLDTQPIAGQTVIPRNYGRGPGLVAIYFSLNRSFQFGPEQKPPPGEPAPKLAPGAKAPKPDRKYQLNAGINVENLFNHVNRATPVGVLPYGAAAGQTLQQALDASLFGKSTGLAFGNNSGNRQIDFQMYFHF